MYDLRNYVDTNCTGTATLLEALARHRHRIKRVVLASSRAVYGEGAYRCDVHGRVSPGLRPRARLDTGQFSPSCPHCGRAVDIVATEESDPKNPVSLYGWTKLQQEQLCRHVSDTFGVEIAILRYFNVIGSRQSLDNPYTGILTVFYKRIVNDRPIPLYELGKPVRDFVHVRDVVAANLRALDAALPAAVVEVNIGSGRADTIRDLAVSISRACGRAPALDESAQFRVGDIFACVADVRYARNVLAYVPAVDLDTGIDEFVTWARTQVVVDDSERAAGDLARHGLMGGLRPRS